MPILGGREQTPIPIHEKILQPDGKPSKEFVRYLLDAKQEGSEGTGGKVPIGTIIMYYGLVIDIPIGWTICDGQNDTPSLVNRFVLGTATEADVGNTGGYAAPQMPAHVHTQTSHTHTIAGHSHSIAHTHTINQHTHTIDHNHGSQTTDWENDHTHSYDNFPVEDGFWSQPDDVSGWSHNSPHPVGQTTGADGGHSHSLDLPNYSGSSGNTSLTTNNTSVSNTGSASTPNTGGATAANTGSTGAGDETLGNYPPYYKLLYLMRTI